MSRGSVAGELRNPAEDCQLVGDWQFGVQLDVDDLARFGGSVGRTPDGCVEPPDQCPTTHLHRTISIHVGTMTVGPIIDTFANPCGHGEVVSAHEGCGPDDVPACAP